MTYWNQADPPEILRFWLSTDPLTLFQAVMLALGRALAETAALLVLSKKVAAIFDKSEAE